MSTSKVEKIRAELERVMEWGKEQAAHTYGNLCQLHECRADMCDKFLSFIDSMQEECNITGIKSKHATGKLKECIDNQTEEGLEQARKQLEDNTQELAFAKGFYRGWNYPKEKPVSEDLEAAIDTYLATYFGSEQEKQEWPFLKKMAIYFANWQKQKDAETLNQNALLYDARLKGIEIGKAEMKQQILKDAFIYKKKHDTAMVLASECLRNHGWFNRERDFNDLWRFICGTKELFRGEFKEGDEVKLIIIKED